MKTWTLKIVDAKFGGVTEVRIRLPRWLAVCVAHAIVGAGGTDKVLVCYADGTVEKCVYEPLSTKFAFAAVRG